MPLFPLAEYKAHTIFFLSVHSSEHLKGSCNQDHCHSYFHLQGLVTSIRRYKIDGEADKSELGTEIKVYFITNLNGRNLLPEQGILMSSLASAKTDYNLLSRRRRSTEHRHGNKKATSLQNKNRCIQERLDFSERREEREIQSESREDQGVLERTTCLLL